MTTRYWINLGNRNICEARPFPSVGDDRGCNYVSMPLLFEYKEERSYHLIAEVSLEDGDFKLPQEVKDSNIPLMAVYDPELNKIKIIQQSSDRATFSKELPTPEGTECHAKYAHSCSIGY